jgi:uncharacterized protein YciI
MHNNKANSRCQRESVYFLFLLMGLSLSIPVGIARSQTEEHVATVDTALVRQFNADEYGMKTYVIAFLKAGPNRSQDSVTAANLLKAHLANIQHMAKEGKLVVAGPFMDDTDLKGIYIFNVGSVGEARALTETDPAIKAGRLVMELHPWYGSAALQKINEIHSRIQTKHF